MRGKRWLPIVAVLGLTLVLLSCTPASTPTTTPPATKPVTTPATTPARTGEPKAIANVQMPKFLTIKGMSDPGGTLAHTAVPVVTNIEKAFSQVSVRQIPGASKEAIDRIISGECELGVGSTMFGYNAWFGIGEYAGKQNRSFRSMFMQPTPWVAFWVAQKGLGITSMKDFTKPGLRISPGMLGYSWTPVFDTILQELYNNSYKKIEQGGGFVMYGNPSDMLDLFAEGKLDVALRMGVDPWPALTKTLLVKNVDWIGLTDQEIAIQLRDVPDYIAGKTPAGTYKGQDKDINGISGTGNLFVKADLSDDVVYNLLWAIFCEGRVDKFGEMHPAYLQPQNRLPNHAVDKVVIPLHPGAEKFWKDWGYKIPAAVVDTNPPKK